MCNQPYRGMKMFRTSMLLIALALFLQACQSTGGGGGGLPAGGAYCEDGGQNGEGPEYSCETPPAPNNSFSINFTLKFKSR